MKAVLYVYMGCLLSGAGGVCSYGNGVCKTTAFWAIVLVAMSSGSINGATDRLKANT